MNKKSQNLMIILLVFCSNTVTRAPERRKYTLRGPNFKIFPKQNAPGSLLQARAFGPWKEQLQLMVPISSLLTQFCCLPKVLF